MRKIILFIFVFLLSLGLKSQTVGFTYTQTSACAPTTFSFTNTSTGNISSYLWDFGDGFTSNSQFNPSHPYQNSGTYTVTLIINFQDGNIDSAKQTIQIFTPPTFTFTKLNDSVCPGASVSFSSTITSSTPIQSYDWDFGDGGKGSSANPTYIYTNPSNITTLYTISLTVTDINGCSTKVDKNNYIYIKQKPIPEFDADQRSFCSSAGNPATVNFTNNTTVTNNNTYYWQFGDGNSSADETPTYTYTGKGNYSVSLTATSPEGCVNSISKPNYIQIVEYTLSYSVSDTILCAVPATVTFQGAAVANVVYSWDFGDGSNGTSAIYPFRINKTYASSGAYTAKVKGNYGNGACFDSSLVVIHVYDSTIAAFTEYDSINHVCKPFYPLGFKDITAYTSDDDFGFGSIVWDFGNNAGAFGDTVSHIFPDFGEHEVTLSITTPYGCKLVDTTKVVVIRPWSIIGGISPYSTCVPYEMGLMDFNVYSSTYVHFTIDWGDGTPNYSIDSLRGAYPKDTTYPFNTTSVSLRSPHHFYHDTIMYVATYTAVNEQGCVIFDTLAMFQGGIPPKAGARYTYAEDCFGEFFTRSKLNVVAFDSLDAEGNPIAGVRADHWFWISKETGGTVGSGNTDSTFLLVDQLGYFSIMMYPTFRGCPGDTIYLDSVAFVCPPMAGFQPFDTAFCNFPAGVQFQNNSVGATAYQWYFGDAQLLSDQSTDTATAPFFEYTLSNSFVSDSSAYPGLRARLIAYNDDSLDINSPTYNRCGFCTDTVFGSIRIANPKLYFKCDTICEKTDFTFYDRSLSRPASTGWRFRLESHDTLIKENTGWHPPMWMWDPFTGLDSAYIDPGAGAKLHFSQPNTYTGYFFNTDDFGCGHSDTVVFHVYPKSIPQFVSGDHPSTMTLSKDTLCINVPDWLYLRDSSYTPAPFDTAEIVAWRWIIEKDTLYGEETVYDSLSKGWHDVSMQITNQYGCTSEKTFEKYILNEEVLAIFYAMKRQYCNHTPVEFYNSSYITTSSTGSRASLKHIWDFGDGSPIDTSSSQRVYHTYHLTQNLPDTVVITLTVTHGEEGCSDTYRDTVIITGPIASFTDDGHTFPCPDFGRQIQFTNTSVGNPTAYYWHFGDSSSGNSNVSYLKDPMHDYLHAGSYDVTLAVTDKIGCTDTLHVPQHVFIDGPVGSFTYRELEGCAPHTIIFTPNISIADSIIINPDRATEIIRTGSDMKDTISFVYQTPGSYLPYFYLIYWTQDGDHSERCVVEWGAKDRVDVIDIIPGFDADSVYCSDDPITFINISTVIPANFVLDSVAWDFGDGSTSHDIDSATVHYQEDGIYTVLLDLYARECHKQISKTIEILSFPEIILNLDSKSGCDSLEFSFYAEVSATDQEKLDFLWTFWDGEVSQSNPTDREFKTSGYYYYRLEVRLDSNKCNKIFSDSIYIDIYTSPSANFEAYPQPAYYGEEISFTDLSTYVHGNIVKWTWDLGDNTGSSEQNPSHTHTTSGKLKVSLFIEDEYGCKSDTTLEIIILESLVFANVLTPTGSDGRKYVFRPLEEMGYYKEFKMHIYNKWGTLIWTNDCKEPNCPDYSDAFWWDGRNRQGKPVEDGVYYWVVSAVPLSETTIFIKNGSVTVFNTR